MVTRTTLEPSAFRNLARRRRLVVSLFLALPAILVGNGMGSFVLPALSRSSRSLTSTLCPLMLPWQAAQAAYLESDSDGITALVSNAGFLTLPICFAAIVWAFTLKPAVDEEGNPVSPSMSQLNADGTEKMDVIAVATQQAQADSERDTPNIRNKPSIWDTAEPETEDGYLPLEGAATTYKVVKEGTPGTAQLERGDTVTMHATGIVRETMKQFWSTKDPGQSTFTFTAGEGVIRGWDAGTRGMTKGEVRRLHIPAAEGYGLAGFPDWGIPPNGDLIFNLELVDIAKQQ
eukprot:TRINITY_DN10860_c0_g5_i1.p1 TRINITY_DN10860_c0_g5~~TRINITY_DN10860_c0_g5_i1.p1  ORF type:complete len:289 (-),score=59.94 TRINITY_DN10860_c0_g5_i1:17-883(-)